MSKHKPIPKKTREKLYEKYNHRCAYCGCKIEYKDMQVDHVKSVYANCDLEQSMTEEEMYNEENFLPACRQCNFYKFFIFHILICNEKSKKRIKEEIL